MSLHCVCVLAQLRLNHTLKKKAAGGYMIDLSKQRDGHKTSRFYGPFAASLPDALTPVLDKYCAVLEFDDVGETGPYLLNPPQGSVDRAMESSAWSQWVSRCFQRHAGVAIAPKTLRSIFMYVHGSPLQSTQPPTTPVPPHTPSPNAKRQTPLALSSLGSTWLRDNTSDGSILKSAAHAMKHAEQRQAGSEYDQQADDRLVKAAYDFNLAKILVSGVGARERPGVTSGRGAGPVDTSLCVFDTLRNSMLRAKSV